MRVTAGFALAWTALVIAGCSGGGVPSAPSVLPSTVANRPLVATTRHTCAHARPHCRLRRHVSTLSIFVANADPYSSTATGYVTAFPTTADGNVPPIVNIGGYNTGLGPASAVAFDSSGNLYVKHKTLGCLSECVSVFAPNANGNVPPIRQICGPNTRINLAPEGGGIAIGPDGTLYVAQRSAIAPQNDEILEFAPGANGDASPSAILTGPNTNLLSPNGIFVDASGKIYVANGLAPGPFDPLFEGSVTIYAPGVSGNAAPIATISGDATTIDEPQGISVDTSGNIHVVDGNTVHGILTFAPGANGDVAPSSAIVGPNTKLFDGKGIAVDSQGTTYVSAFDTNPTDTGFPPAIVVFAPGASGDAAPQSVITGAQTKLFQFGFLALHVASETHARLTHVRYR